MPINVDNYFFDLGSHPTDPRGDYDFETPQALDIELFMEMEDLRRRDPSAVQPTHGDAAPAASSRATTSACGPPKAAWWPSPTGLPAASRTTAPTMGLGAVVPSPFLPI